jgi:hypothetical protein
VGVRGFERVRVYSRKLVVVVVVRIVCVGRWIVRRGRGQDDERIKERAVLC